MNDAPTKVDIRTFTQSVRVCRGTDTVNFEHEGKQYSVLARETGTVIGARIKDNGSAELIYE